MIARKSKQKDASSRRAHSAQNSFLKGKVVLVTGGTGSFGRNFITYILAHSGVKKVIVFSRDELKQSQMASEISDERMRYFLGDVRDLKRLERAFEGVDIVVHAAALKQVPALEYNPFEAIQTNIIGSQNVIEAAIDTGVKKAVLISTDKAALPVNLYGSTKLCAEKLFTAGNAYSTKTRFGVVRYGNVIGSRGSIIEILLKNKGAHTVHITDERMTRFWIDLEQTFAITLFALAHMEGGEIFIPKAPTMKLTDLFNAIVPRAKRKVIGMRPGEKIHEILLTKEEAQHSVELEKYFVVLPEYSRKTTLDADYLKKGKKLPKDFSYESQTSDLLLSEKELMRIVHRLEERMA